LEPFLCCIDLITTVDKLLKDDKVIYKLMIDKDFRK